MIQQIKELRVKIDGLAQLTKGLKPIEIEKTSFENNTGLVKTKNNIKYVDKGLIIILEKNNSKEIEKAVDSLYLAKAWLGKVLGELGNENPYGSGYKTKEDIEPTADVNQDIHGYNLDVIHFEDKNHIEKVDWLRQEIEKVVNEIKHLDSNISNHHTQRPSREFAIARTNAYNHACEARFWLGFELQRIKNVK
jgi:hypothetical protein